MLVMFLSPFPLLGSDTVGLMVTPSWLEDVMEFEWDLTKKTRDS